MSGALPELPELPGSPDAPDDVDVAMVAASLRADAADVTTYARVLTETLGDALPAGMVDVERARSLGDRMAGRPGRVVRLVVGGRDRRLELEQTPRGVVSRLVREVRGVVIARDEVDLDTWLQALAAEVTVAARSSAASRAALRAFLQT